MRGGFPGFMSAALQANSTPAAAPPAAGIIESIQQIEFTIASSSATGTKTITSVDTANTAIFFSTHHFGGRRQTDTSNGSNNTQVRVDLTNATTVTATRNASPAFAIDVICTVVEYTSAAISSIQQGSITVLTTSPSNTDTITSVDVARSVVVHNGQSTIQTNTVQGSVWFDVALTNATTVTVTRDRASSTTTIVNYVVIEFATGVVDSVQEFNITITDAGAATATATITSVDTSVSAIFPGGIKCNDTGAINVDHDVCHAQLTNGTTVTATRSAVLAVQPTVAGTVVEFASGKTDNVQRGVATVDGGSLTEDVTVTSVETSRSVVSALSCTSDSVASFDTEEQTFTLEIVNATTIRAKRNVTGRDIIFSWELVEYAA